MTDVAPQARRSALFLDRDGVVNVDHGYVHRREDVTFVDGIFALGRAAHHAGLPLVVVTNQAGIGRGYYDDATFHAVMTWMGEQFAREGCPLAAVYYCPHHPDATERYRRSCDCRKPAPGMLLAAARDLHLDLASSLIVGDTASDMRAGAAAGLRQLFLLSDTEPLGDATRIASLHDVIATLPPHGAPLRPRPLTIRAACDDRPRP